VTKFSFVFEVLAKKPPSILFALAAFVLALAISSKEHQVALMPWASNFF
jgi:hypothetical protein